MVLHTLARWTSEFNTLGKLGEKTFLVKGQYESSVSDIGRKKVEKICKIREKSFGKYIL